MMRGLLAFALCLVAACGDEPYETQLALQIGPGDLAPAKTLTAHALLDGKPSSLTFQIASGPLTRLGVRIEPKYQGLLHLDIEAADATACVVWQGQLERQIPAREEITLTLLQVTPPRCP